MHRLLGKTYDNEPHRTYESRVDRQRELVDQISYMFESINPNNMAMLFLHFIFYMYVSMTYKSIGRFTKDPCTVQARDTVSAFNNWEGREAMEQIINYMNAFVRFARSHTTFKNYASPKTATSTLDMWHRR